MIGQLTKENLLSQRTLDLVLDQTGHRPCAHQRVITTRCQPATRRIRHLELHVLVFQLRLQFGKELVHHVLDNLVAEATKLDNGVQAVTELGGEALLDRFHGIGSMILMGKAHRSPRRCFGTRVGGHDDDHVAEVRLAPVVVGQRTVIHDLQQQVEDFRMRLLDFIEQQYAVRLLGDGLGQQPPLIETDIARRCTDQTRYGMALHVLGHVEANQLDTQGLCQLARGLGFTDTGGPGEQERTHRFVRRLEPGTGQLNRSGQRIDRCILTEYGQAQVAFKVAQQLLVRDRDVFWRNSRDFRHDIFNLRHFNALDPTFNRLQTLVGTCFVDHVNGLVRHVPVIDIARGQLSRCAQGLITVFDAVVLLEATFKPAQNADGVFNRRFGHVDFLETARQGTVFFEDPAKFLERGGTDAANVTRGQQWLEQVGSVHHAARSRTGTDDRVDFIDKQNRLRAFLQLAEQRLEALLEIATVLGTRQQGAEIQGVDDAVSQQVRHLIVDDTLGQALGNRGFTHAGLADQQRVVFAPTRQNLGDALNFHFATHQRINPALTGQFIQIAGISVQRIAGGRRLAALFILHFMVAVAVFAMPRHLGDAMGNKVDHIDARHALLLEQEYGLAFLFTEDGYQHIGTGHFTLAGALHMEHRTLQDPLKTQGWLSFAVFVVDGDQGGRGINKLLQVMLEFVEVCATGA